MKKFAIWLLFWIVGGMVLPLGVRAAAVSWDGGASTANWADANNWSSNTVPSDADDVTINQNVTVNIAAGTTINSLTIGQNGGGTTPTLNFSYDAISNGAMVIDSGNLVVHTGAIITHSAGTTVVVGRININVLAGGGTITGTINASDKGFQSNAGDGVGPGNGGGGHGGTGGKGSVGASGGAAYGDLTAPITLGSGGGTGEGGTAGKGGGAIKISVGTSLAVTGSVTANGGNATSCYSPGGGAGGSIQLSAPTLSGAGTISVNGGNGCQISNSGAGAGGRIALIYTTKTFNGTLTAYGSGASDKNRYGGAGTIFEHPASQTNGNLTVDNNNKMGFQDYNTGGTPLGTNTFETITVRNYGRLITTPSTNVNYLNINWETKGIVVDNGGTFPLVSSGEGLTVPATAYFFANTTRTFTNLTVNGVMTHSENMTAPNFKIDLTVTGNAEINGSINLNELGFQGGNGDGVGGSRSGAGHGGIGGSTTGVGGATYGDMTAPTIIGSGGGFDGVSGGLGGKGGGAVKLSVGGTLTTSGSITAGGGDGQSCYSTGGGSGGSIYLITGSFAGSTGSITANGHDGCGTGGGGAGGRVAVYYSNSNTYSGTLAADTAGLGSPQIGTVFVKAIVGEIISNPFDTGDPATLIYDLAWSETLTEGTDVKFQLRTASDVGGSIGTWSEWMGPGGEGTFYTDPSGGENIQAAHSDASGDQWVQYKAILTASTGNQNLPKLTEVTLTYVINSPPNVTITNTPNESSSGLVAIDYTVSDPEESTLEAYLAVDTGITLSGDYNVGSTDSLGLSAAGNMPANGTVMIDNEMMTYTGKSGNNLTGITRATNTTINSGHTAGVAVWLVAKEDSLDGDIGTIDTSGSKSVNWTPATTMEGVETSTAKIKIVVNDGNLANQLDEDMVTGITLDTKAPSGGTIYLNNRTNQLILTASDANIIYYKASNLSSLGNDGINTNSGNWMAYATNVDWVLSVDPATAYAAFKDQYGNETTIYTTTGPSKLTTFLIQDASNPETSEWRLFVSWPAVTVPVNGFDYYQIYRSTDNINFEAYLQVDMISQNYIVDTGLDSNTTYYYKATVVDDHGNESDYNETGSSGRASNSGVGLTPDGSGGGDFTPPTISEVEVENLTSTGATINWTTDELANSTVGYSTNTGYANEVGSITMTTSHSVILTNLNPNTTYYFRLTSYDAISNKAILEDSSTQNFTTLSDTSGPVISNVRSAVGETSAGITWSTNEAADSRVEYSIDTSYSGAVSSATMAQGHALTITGLTIDTTYNYRVISIDSSGNSTTSPEYTFITTSVTEADLDLTAPSISGISVGEITATSAKVSWSTSENADGKVEYGESTNYERGIAEGNHDFKTSKSVILIGLSPETGYHYRITAIDMAGNVNTSADSTFTTGSQANLDTLTDAGESSGANAPAISSAGPGVSDITGTSVKISWDTTKKSTGQVYYKVKNSLDTPSQSGNMAFNSSHALILNGLTPATTYEFQVKSSDVNGNYVISTKYEFTTSLPGVLGVKITNKSASEALVEWQTAIPTTTVVEYINSASGESKRYSNTSLQTRHQAILDNLYPGSLYMFTVMIADEAGNLARSEQYSFKTGDDTVGPAITSLDSRSTIVAGQNKVQTVITWTTNEPTTSQVEYSLGTGTGDYEQQTRENHDYVLNHIMVVANLKPGSVYRYRVLSRDRSDNKTTSEAYVLLTPQKEVSALDLIIQNLQSSFGWVRKLER